MPSSTPAARPIAMLRIGTGLIGASGTPGCSTTVALATGPVGAGLGGATCVSAGAVVSPAAVGVGWPSLSCGGGVGAGACDGAGSGAFGFNAIDPTISPNSSDISFASTAARFGSVSATEMVNSVDFGVYSTWV